MYMELLYIAYQPERNIQERTERYHHLHLRNMYISSSDRQGRGNKTTKDTQTHSSASHMYMYMYMYMRTLVNHNSLGCRQPSGLPIADVFQPVYQASSAVLCTCTLCTCMLVNACVICILAHVHVHMHVHELSELSFNTIVVQLIDWYAVIHSEVNSCEPRKALQSVFKQTSMCMHLHVYHVHVYACMYHVTHLKTKQHKSHFQRK